VDSISISSESDGAFIAMVQRFEDNIFPGPQIHISKHDDPSGKEMALKKTLFCFKMYKAKDGDTLWDIARRFYGQGLYYPVLLEHNPDINIYDITHHTTLRYLCDKDQAPKVYKKITGMINDKKYWKYKVRPGDTKSSVVKRYCPGYKNCFVEDTFPEVGKTIGIFLE